MGVLGKITLRSPAMCYIKTITVFHNQSTHVGLTLTGLLDARCM